MTLVETICRAICVADGVDPDAEGCGLGVHMPEGEKYPLWKAREKQAVASALEIRGAIFDDPKLSPLAKPSFLMWLDGRLKETP